MLTDTGTGTGRLRQTAKCISQQISVRLKWDIIVTFVRSDSDSESTYCQGGLISTMKEKLKAIVDALGAVRECFDVVETLREGYDWEGGPGLDSEPDSEPEASPQASTALLLATIAPVYDWSIIGSQSLLCLAAAIRSLRSVRVKDGSRTLTSLEIACFAAVFEKSTVVRDLLSLPFLALLGPEDVMAAACAAALPACA